MKLEKLNKKVFYLDTNILYRALGINGAERKQRSHSFLRKLIEAAHKHGAYVITVDYLPDTIAHKYSDLNITM